MRKAISQWFAVSVLICFVALQWHARMMAQKVFDFRIGIM